MSDKTPTYHDGGVQRFSRTDGLAEAETGGPDVSNGPGAAPRGETIARVLPDEEESGNGTVRVSVAAEGLAQFRRDLYVRIVDGDQNVAFLGRVVEGPYHRPPSSANGASRYWVVGIVELMGEIEDGARLKPTAVRPRPDSAVEVFSAGALQALLGIEGDLYLGRLIGGEAVGVRMQSSDKNFLPRNVGVFGTVGSGKSNTMQVLMEEALQAGWAVVTIDVEGEYVRMGDPTDERRMIELLASEHSLAPKGVDDYHVYVPAAAHTDAASPLRFKVPISAMQREIVADILNFSEGQVRMFEAATKQASSRNEYLQRQDGRRRAAEDTSRVQRPYTLQDLIDGLQESNQSVPLIPRIRPEDLPTAASLRAKLTHLGRSNVLDWNATEDVVELPVDDLLFAGRLSVLDISETDDRSRNIAIAYTLQALFERIVQLPVGARMPDGGVRPPLLVVVEEVHTFVSRATVHRMRAVLDNLQVISRRGRKRWMALALISQQPNHVPDELFELANTRFVHQMKSASNLDTLKTTTGGVHDELWSTVSTLGPGECLFSSSSLPNALLLSARPAQSRRAFSR